MSEERLLNIRLQMEELICTREGMLAINQFRINRGEVIAYNESEFDNLRSQFEHLRKIM